MAPSSGTGRVGTTLLFDIKGGVKPYSVLSNSPSIATATVNDRTLSVQLNLAGSTVIVVRDNAGATKQVTVSANTVTAAPLIVTPPERQISETNTADVVFGLGDGVPPFIAVVPFEFQNLVTPIISADNTQLILRVGAQGNRCVPGTRTVEVDVYDQTGVGKKAKLVINETGAACP